MKKKQIVALYLPYVILFTYRKKRLKVCITHIFGQNNRFWQMVLTTYCEMIY